MWSGVSRRRFAWWGQDFGTVEVSALVAQGVLQDALGPRRRAFDAGGGRARWLARRAGAWWIGEPPP
jgi:hypothetical protein